jgi:hypothetical protein
MATSTTNTWGNASLRQTTDFTPGYIAERACQEELKAVGRRWHDDVAYTYSVGLTNQWGRGPICHTPPPRKI